MPKCVVMVSVVDMEPETPGNEDVIASIHVVAEGADQVAIAGNAVQKAQMALMKTTKEDGTPLVKESHQYHSVVNILAVIPEKDGKQIVVPNVAAAQAILKRGEVSDPRKAILTR